MLFFELKEITRIIYPYKRINKPTTFPPMKTTLFLVFTTNAQCKIFLQLRCTFRAHLRSSALRCLEAASSDITRQRQLPTNIETESFFKVEPSDRHFAPTLGISAMFVWPKVAPQLKAKNSGLIAKCILKAANAALRNVYLRRKLRSGPLRVGEDYRGGRHE